MQDWHEIAKDLRFNQNMGFSDIARQLKDYFPELCSAEIREKVRSYVRKQPEYIANQKSNQVTISKAMVSLNKDGSTSREIVFELSERKELTANDIMELHNLNIDDWQVISYTNNYWEAQIKGGKHTLMCQSKLTVKPVNKGELTLKDVDRHFTAHKYKPITIPERKETHTDGYTLEVCFADWHCGLLATNNTCDNEYNLYEARRRVLYCVRDIEKRSKDKPIKKIEFVLLGDLIHVDNEQQTTVKGTFQQTDGFMSNILDETVDTLVDALLILNNIAPVNVTWVSGNHSVLTEYITMKCVEALLPQITFDIEYNPVKILEIGENALIELSHGDMPKKNLGNKVDAKAREIGGIKYIESHSGHLHSDISYEDRGITIRHIPTICGASCWENRNGYNAYRSFVSFLWDDTKGIHEYWVNNIEF